MARVLARFNRQAEADADRRKLHKILRDTPAPEANGNAPSTAVDAPRLRGLPSVAPGVSGAIPGTRPDRAILRDRRRRG